MTVVVDSDEFFDELYEYGDDFEHLVLVEGDSWVSHPFMTNLGDRFDKLPGYNNLVLNLGVPGDNAVWTDFNADAVFKANGQQRRVLKKILTKPGWSETFDLIFISAAGNDIIGPEIAEIPLVFKKSDYPGSYGRDLINPAYYSRIKQVADGYRRFLKMLRAHPRNKTTPVITHAYAYLQPREVGTHLFGHMFNRGWVAQHMRRQGVRDPDEQYEIVVELFDRYYQQISAVQQEDTRFLVADTRKALLRQGLPNTDWFYDEIHPTTAGFRKVFNRIRKQATDAGLWTI